MKKKSYIRTAEHINSLTYTVTEFDEDGWAETKKALPIPFDLVLMKTNTDKKIIGWWNQQNWEGIRLRSKDKVVKWKRRRFEHICK